ncbi:hypothetical protein [Serratia sp. 1D1416]|uniref:hypothetical protein n=1 Tax=Serratia sp. 1D1416 TaxID=2447890 RepID=UPI0013ED25B9|nr:hypothetical protein [Serratia sp. 1D1416]
MAYLFPSFPTSLKDYAGSRYDETQQGHYSMAAMDALGILTHEKSKLKPGNDQLPVD